jgi:hypothetical protein
MYRCLADSSQNAGELWSFQSDGTIKNPISGRCLYNPSGTSANGQLVIQDCDASDPGMLWVIPRTKYAPIKSTSNNMCVDDKAQSSADGNIVQSSACNGGPGQYWASVPSDDDKSVTFRVFGKCLDVYGAGTTNGTKVDLWTCNGTAAQNWIVRSDKTVMNTNSGKCLNNPGGTTATQLTIQTCSATTASMLWTAP